MIKGITKRGLCRVVASVLFIAAICLAASFHWMAMVVVLIISAAIKVLCEEAGDA